MRWSAVGSVSAQMAGVFWLIIFLLVGNGCATPNIFCADGCRAGIPRREHQWSTVLGDQLTRLGNDPELFVHPPTGAMEVATDCGNPSTLSNIVYAMIPVIASEAARLRMGSGVLRAESAHRGSAALNEHMENRARSKCDRALERALGNNADPQIIKNVELWLEERSVKVPPNLR